MLTVTPSLFDQLERDLEVMEILDALEHDLEIDLILDEILPLNELPVPEAA